MRICDICKTNGAHCDKYVTFNEKGNGKSLELCWPCYDSLCNKEQYHAFLAYKETVEERTGEEPKKKSWLFRFKI